MEDCRDNPAEMLDLVVVVPGKSTNLEKQIDQLRSVSHIFTKNALQTALQGISAERTRFELVVRYNPYVGLANRWFQPLTHLSKPLLGDSQRP